MNVFSRWNLFVLLFFPLFLLRADESDHATSRRAAHELMQKCLNENGASCDKEYNSSGGAVATTAESLTEEDRVVLETKFPALAQIAGDYPRFFDWTREALKEKEEPIKAELEALEKDMRMAAAVAVELAKAKSPNAGEQPSQSEEQSKSDGSTATEPGASQNPARGEASADSARGEASSEPSESKPSDKPEQPSARSRSGPRTFQPKIFQPKLADIPLIKLALNKVVQNTNFPRDLGSSREGLTDEAYLAELIGRVAEGVVNFGERIDLDTDEEYPVSRTGAPLDAGKYAPYRVK